MHGHQPWGSGFLGLSTSNVNVTGFCLENRRQRSIISAPSHHLGAENRRQGSTISAPSHHHFWFVATPVKLVPATSSWEVGRPPSGHSRTRPVSIRPTQKNASPDCCGNGPRVHLVLVVLGHSSPHCRPSRSGSPTWKSLRSVLEDVTHLPVSLGPQTHSRDRCES